jgi:cytochrome c
VDKFPYRWLLLLALTHPTLAHAGGDIQAGKALFASRCASCHSVGPAARAGFGPQLNGVIGRRAGSTPDFGYSPAMRSAGFAWTEPQLRRFLASPADVVPGNRMRFWGIGDEKKLNDLLAYLRKFR